jgi:hypothetical protein
MYIYYLFKSPFCFPIPINIYIYIYIGLRSNGNYDEKQLRHKPTTTNKNL